MGALGSKIKDTAIVSKTAMENKNNQSYLDGIHKGTLSGKEMAVEAFKSSPLFFFKDIKKKKG